MLRCELTANRIRKRAVTSNSYVIESSLGHPVQSNLIEQMVEHLRVDLRTKIISDSVDKKFFTLVDSKGNEITEKEQLGLLLYRGGRVCNYGYNHNNKGKFTGNVADAICKEMNFTRAERWTTKERFDIQSNYDYVHLWNVECSRADWSNCTYLEYTGSTRYHRNCLRSQYDVFLSCTGKVVII